MKCGEIGVDEFDPEETRTLEYLSENKEQTLLGRLFFSLLEHMGSTNFTVNAYMNSVKPYLVIDHPVLQEQEKMIILETFPALTAEGVLTAVRAHMQRLSKGLQSDINQLQSRIDALAKAERSLSSEGGP